MNLVKPMVVHVDVRIQIFAILNVVALFSDDMFPFELSWFQMIFFTFAHYWGIGMK